MLREVTKATRRHEGIVIGRKRMMGANSQLGWSYDRRRLHSFIDSDDEP